MRSNFSSLFLAGIIKKNIRNIRRVALTPEKRVIGIKSLVLILSPDPAINSLRACLEFFPENSFAK